MYDSSHNNMTARINIIRIITQSRMRYLGVQISMTTQVDVFISCTRSVLNKTMYMYIVHKPKQDGNNKIKKKLKQFGLN